MIYHAINTNVIVATTVGVKIIIAVFVTITTVTIMIVIITKDTGSFLASVHEEEDLRELQYLNFLILHYKCYWSALI